jgi:3-hydroxyisobutyrate dehydrogenase-like beta-hydroxyacid dehydrogenase
VTRIAFCGLGQMGAPMAGRVVEAGHEVTVWNRTPERALPLGERGARVASTPEEAASGAEAAITMLADPPALEEVLFGQAGLASGLEPGSTVIDMSTVGPEAIRDAAARLPEGVRMIDAPVRGSVREAESGKLIMLVGGDRDDVHRWSELLSAMGTPEHVGPLGAGASMKLVANMALGSTAAVVGEALALAEGLGLDLQATLDMLEQTPVGRYVANSRERIEAGDWRPRFKLRLANKDLALATEAGPMLPVAEAVRAAFTRAEEAGRGDEDYTAIIDQARRI